MKLLTAAEILAADDSTFEDVPVPEWGKDAGIRLRSLTGEERDAFEKSVVRVTGKGKSESREVIIEGMRAKLIARCAVDDKGVRLFSDADIAKLGKKNGAVIDRLFAIAQKLSGLSQEDVAELAGESEAAQNSSSSTG